MKTKIVYWGYVVIMETKMETTIVYWGYLGIMANKMETTIVYSSSSRRGSSGQLSCCLCLLSAERGCPDESRLC